MEFLIGIILEFIIEGLWFLCFGPSPGSEPEPAPPPVARTQTAPRSTPPRLAVRIRLPSPPKAQFVGPRFVYSLGEDTRCLICGHPLERDVVACPDCATLHHEECWVWTSGCSTYGCIQASSRDPS